MFSNSNDHGEKLTQELETFLGQHRQRVVTRAQTVRERLAELEHEMSELRVLDDKHRKLGK